MNKILIIGALGFIGRNVSTKLAETGYTVTAADLAPQIDDLHRVIHYVQIDVNKISSNLELIMAHDTVIYLANSLLPQASNERPIYDLSSNLLPLVELLEILKKAPEKRLIFASSGGTVYGPMTDKALSEDSPTNPTCSYGIVKLTSEKYIALYRQLYGVQGIVLRIANPFGFGQDFSRPQGAIGVFVHKAKRHLPISIWGDGSLVRDYIWVGDVATAFQSACEYAGNSHVFNISTGIGTSINDLLLKMAILANRDLEVSYQPARTFDVPSNVISNALAQKELSWTPSVKLDEGITQLWNSTEF
jgi:UDP-glucose 4-epimerase